MGSKALSGFIAGFKAGWAMIPSKSDEEYQRAKTRALNANAALDEERVKRSGEPDLGAAVKRKQIENYDNLMKNRDAAEKRAVSKPTAIPAGEVAKGPELTDEEVEEGLASPMEFSKGGAVPLPREQRFAEGGAVEPAEDVNWRQEAALTPAIPMPAPKQQTPQQTPQAMGGPAGFSYTAALDAAEEGMNGLVEKYKLDTDQAVDTPESDKRVQQFSEAKGGGDVKQLRQLDQIVDPTQQLSESQRNMKKLAWVYETYRARGQSERAKEAVTDLTETYKMVFNRYQAIAKAAAEGGNIDEAIKAAVRSYAYVPDGNDIQLQKTPDGRFAYSYTDSVTGKVISKGLKTPDEMLQIVTKHGMSSFEDLVSAGAGKRYEELTKGKADAKALDEGKRFAGAIGGAPGSTPSYEGMDREAVSSAATINADRDKVVAEQDEDSRVRREEDAASETPKWTREAATKPATRQEFADIPIGGWFINPEGPQAGVLMQKVRPKAKSAAAQ